MVNVPEPVQWRDLYPAYSRSVGEPVVSYANAEPNRPPFNQVDVAVDGHAFGVSCRPRQLDMAVDGLVRSWRNIA